MRGAVILALGLFFLSGVPSALGSEEFLRLKANFQRAQSDERQALEHRLRLESEGSEELLRSRIQNWNDQEKRARTEYFRKNPVTDAGKFYEEDYQIRKKRFYSEIETERKQILERHRLTRESLKTRQKNNLQKFEELLKAGKQPTQDLWPD